MSNRDFMKLDLHTHSHHSSDAITKPETLLRVAKKRGLGIAITDHSTTSAWAELRRLNRKYNIPVVYGQEIKTFREGKRAGELIGLFLQEEINAQEYPEVIDGIRAQGAMVVVPHPFDFMRENFKFLSSIRKKVGLLEVYNARCYLKAFNSKALEYAEKHGIAGSAGSDAHTPEEVGNAYVQVKASGLEEARRKLVKGDADIFGRKSGLFAHLKTALAKASLIRER